MVTVSKYCANSDFILISWNRGKILIPERCQRNQVCDQQEPIQNYMPEEVFLDIGAHLNVDNEEGEHIEDADVTYGQAEGGVMVQAIDAGRDDDADHEGDEAQLNHTVQASGAVRRNRFFFIPFAKQRRKS